MASIESIPASHSIGIEVLDKLGGDKVLQFIVTDGDPLPKKGNTSVKAGQTIKTGSSHSLNIKIWEGGIQEKIDDNRFIGLLRISGTDFENGIIATGDELVCEYEVSDSGNLFFQVSVPSIGATFPAKFVIDDKPDLNNVEKVIEDGEILLNRIEEIAHPI